MPRLVRTLLAAAALTPAASAQCTDAWLSTQPGNGLGSLEVRCSTLWDPDGAGPAPVQLVVGGHFGSTFSGSVVLNSIARWDGIAWAPLHNGLNLYVEALTVFNGDLVAGGFFIINDAGPGHNIARFDGSRWRRFDMGLGNPQMVPESDVRTLAVHNGELYAAGTFGQSSAGALIQRIARWDGEHWQQVGAGLDDRVNAIHSYQGQLYAGGIFGWSGAAPVHRFARWDGQAWTAIPISGVVRGFIEHEGRLIVGGGFDSIGGLNATGIAAFDGSAWSPLPGMGGHAYTFAVHGGDLWAAGAVVSAGGSPSPMFARWDGSAWWPAPGIAQGPSASVLTLASHRGELVIGGRFQIVNGLVAYNVARYAPAAPWFARDPEPAHTAPGGAVQFDAAAATGYSGLAYQWRLGGVPLADGPTPHGSLIQGAGTPTLTITNAQPQDAGPYACALEHGCGQAQSSAALLTVAPPACYANCDSSTQAPVLNTADFTCFLARFAAGDPYANCDGSTLAPELNVSDFTCFLQRFAAGCR